MNKQQIESDWGIYVPDTCYQTIRPMSSLLSAISAVQEKIDKPMFEFLFGIHGNRYHQKFEKEYHRNIINFWNDLPPSNQAKLSSYIESVTATYEVEKHIHDHDLHTLLNCNRYMIPSILRDINYAKYGGTIDENATLQWVSKKRNKVKK